jgi:hypothetical protein
MRFRRSKQGILLSLAAVLLGSHLATSAPPEPVPKERKIELSAPPDNEVATNLNLLNTKRDGLRRLEDDLFKPLQTFAPKSSLDGMSVPPVQTPTRSVIPNKRMKELLDRKKKWGLMAPEDFMAEATGEEIFNLPDYDQNGIDKKKQSPVERFFDRLDNKHKGELDLGESNDQENRKKPIRFGDPGNAEQTEFLKGLNASESALKNEMIDLNSRSSLQPLLKPALQELFGLGAKPPSREELEIHKQRMTDYGNLIGLNPSDAPLDSLEPVSPVSPVNGWGSLYPPVRSASPALPPGATPAALPSPSAGLPNSYNLRSALEPAPSPPREASKALPTVLDFPKRKF